jgi:hypothetical protein
LRFDPPAAFAAGADAAGALFPAGGSITAVAFAAGAADWAGAAWEIAGVCGMIISAS